MKIKSNIKLVNESLLPNCRLIAVSKTQPIKNLEEAYEAGQRIFGENKVQEMEEKYQALPKDIEWHMIGHLQTNKVKYIAPFVTLIHSVDSLKLAEEINKQGKKLNRKISCLFQIFIANEETKFGFSETEVLDLIDHYPLFLTHIQINGLMGMASFTDDQDQIRKEFRGLKQLFEKIKKKELPPTIRMEELSIGMSSDYKIAMEEGSTLVRLGTAIFGDRNTSK